MKKLLNTLIGLGIFITFSHTSVAEVAPVVPGEALWCIDKRIASTTDVIESKVCVVDSTIDVLKEEVSDINELQASVNETLEKACDIQSKVGLIEGIACASTPITSAGTISTPGIYCLANSIIGQITIAVSDVELDLNGHMISGGTNGVAVNSGLNNITIKDGTISSSNNGIDVSTGCSHVTILHVNTINCDVVGIKFDASSNSSVLNCDMSINTTGLELHQSFKIIVDNCLATCNTQAGFSLLFSTTNCFNNCKALSNGEGQTSEAQDVFGFVSNSGFGNVFEGCIANSTQALTTTDANSVAAGFAFLGTEMCSKIINSESANTKTDPSGLTIPYGIFLQAQLDTLETKTSANHGSTVQSVDWSPDGKFLAIGGLASGGVEIRVFEYDRTNNALTQLATAVHGGAVFSVNWSPDGRFLAIGGNTGAGGVQIRVYEFNSFNNTLTQVDEKEHGFIVNAVNWSSDGKFLAIGGNTGAGGVQIRVYAFDCVSRTLVEIAMASPGASVLSVNWSSDGAFLAAGGDESGGFDIRVYKFDVNSNTPLMQVDMKAHGASVFSVNWSPDDKFLAIGGNTFDDVQIRVYQFDTVGTTTLIQVAAADHEAQVISVDWSPDGKFLAIGGDSSPGSIEVRVYDFNRNNTTLNQVDEVNNNFLVANVNWSPDGACLAIGDSSSIRIFSALEFPSKNVIKNNIVYCNKGNECPAGIGISGSNIVNLIIGNTAYENVKNYEFITNIYDGTSGFLPNPFQNLDAKPPLCDPINLACKVCVIEDKFCDMQSKVDAILAAV